MKHSLSQQINDAFDREDWSHARGLLLKHLKRDPDDHWLLTRLSTAFFEERKYKQSMKYVRRAFELAPDCPLVLWDYAGTLLAVGKVKEARALYRQIIERRLEFLRGPHSEGRKWMWSLVLDCIFMIGVCEQNLGKHPVAARHFASFIAHRARWNGGSIHTIDEAIARLSRLKRLNGAREVEQLTDKQLLSV